MSIQSEINRIIGLRDRIGAAIKSWGIASSGSDLQDYTEAIEDVTDRGGGGGDISSKTGEVDIPAGYYDGRGSVKIASAEQQKIIPGNIKQGVIILGVTGSYSGEGTRLQSKTVTPTKSTQNVSADEGYDALSQVTVNPIPEIYQDVSGVTATAADVLSGKTIVTEDGNVSGTMQNRGSMNGTVGLSKESYSVSAGYWSGGTVSIDDSIENALAEI